MDKCDPASDHKHSAVLMPIKDEYILTEDKDANNFTPISIKIKQESDNSTQDETYNYIGHLAELTHESNQGTKYVEQQPDTSGVDVIKIRI